VDPAASRSNPLPGIDLDAYLGRIDLPRPGRASLAALEHLQAGHLAAIPFENIDVRLGRTISLSLDDLQEKLVRRRRGGYCFEQNTLFAAALGALGFRTEALEARVRTPATGAVRPRTHMTLRVTIEGRAWLVDVGFGGDGPLAPVPIDGGTSEQEDAAYQVAREDGDVRVLRRRWRGTWEDLYAFTMSPPYPIDFEVANHFTSTWPGSIFRKTLTAQRSERGLRRILRGLVFTIRRGEEETAREVEPADIPALLRDEIGIDIPDQDALKAAGPD